nr:hypothetical protein [Tanacetum cinerariifolium]
MSWFLRCSWSGGPFNGENCRRCINVSFGDEFVRNPDHISYDETPDFSYPPPQPQVYSCELCGNDSHYGYDCLPQCQPRNQNFYEPYLCYNSNSSSFDQPPQYSIDHQPQSIQEYLNQKRMNDVHNRYNDMIESRNELLKTM